MKIYSSPSVSAFPSNHTADSYIYRSDLELTIYCSECDTRSDFEPGLKYLNTLTFSPP